jgi:hypothetical protein
MIFGSTKPGLVRTIVMSVYAIFASWLLFNLVRLGRDPSAQVVDQLIAASGERAVLGPERIIISRTGVRSDHAFHSLMHAWPGVESIDNGEEGVAIKTGARTSYFIPRRAFANDLAMHEFAEHAKRWRSAAQNWHQTCPECGYDLRGAEREGCPECGWRREGA